MEELSPAEIDDLLARCGVGVLSLFDGSYPYAIPMSFGYDGEQSIFAVQLGSRAGGYKRQCLDASRNVCFTVYDEPSPDIWQSVVIQGQLVEVPEAESEPAFAALAANAEFPADVQVWGVPLDEADLTLYALSPDDVTGRKYTLSGQRDQ